MKKNFSKKILLLAVAFLLACVMMPVKALSQTKYEAEAAALTGVVSATAHAGYSGSGYIDGFDNSADKVTFTVNVPTAGAYPLVIRYSTPSGEKFQNLQVNGTTVSACALQFPANAGWADKAYGNVNLNAGNNTIAIVSCYGWFHLDYITVGSGGGNTLTVSPTTLIFGTAAGSSNISVTSNVSWTVTDDQSWISVSPASGSNNGTVAVSATANTGAARSGTVTITGGSITRTVSVSQAAATTKYEAESAALTGVTIATAHTGYSGSGYIDGFDNSADKVTFTVNVPTAGAYPLVIHYSAPSGEKFQNLQVNGTTVSACALQFPSNANWADKVYGNVTLNAGNNTIAIVSCYGWFHLDYITVGGSGPPQNNLSVSPGTLNFSSAAGSNNVTVTSNVSWTVADNQTWLSVSPASGSNNGTIAVSVTANTGSSSRTGSVTVTGSGLSPQTVSVTQAGTGSPPSGTMTAGTNFWNIGWDGWQSYFASGVNWSNTTNPWNPTFISELQQAKIKCLRFMDWNMANDICISNWNERIPKTANHYNTDNKLWCYTHNYDGATNTHTIVPYGFQGFGVAYEWQIDLCNRIGADIWINLPMNASNDYLTQLANLLNSQLNAGLKIYVEYGNENWNSGFSTWVYAWDKAKALGLDNIDVGAFSDPWRKHTVYASVRAFERFEAVFGVNSSRLVKVIGGQLNYHWGGFDYNHMAVGDLAALNNSTINPNHTTINAWAVAPYLGGQSMQAMRDEIPVSVQYLTWAKNSLNGTGLLLLGYEGGADNYPDNNPPLALARNAEQEQIYIDFLTAIAPIFNGVFNQYTFYGGTWGLKYAAGESASINPKWRGWVSYWNANSPGGRVRTGSDEEVTEEISEGKSVHVFPNPANINILTAHIRSERETKAEIVMIGSNSQRVVDMRSMLMKGENTIQIPIGHLKNGLHLLIINTGNERTVKKIVVEK